MNEELRQFLDSLGLTPWSVWSFLWDTAHNRERPSRFCAPPDNFVFHRRLIEGQSFWVKTFHRRLLTISPESLTTVGSTPNLVTFFMGARRLEYIRNVNYFMGELSAQNWFVLMGIFNSSYALQNNTHHGILGLQGVLRGESRAPFSPPVLTNATVANRFVTSFALSCIMLLELVRRERERINSNQQTD